MKVLLILSCVATLVICQPIMHRPHNIRKRPPHLHHKQQDLSNQQSESKHSDVLPRNPDQESRIKEPTSIRENKVPSHPAQNSFEQQSEPVPKNKEQSQHKPSHPSHHRRPSLENEIQRLPALKHEEKHDEYGQYALRYVTADNTVVSERGRLVPTAEGGYVLEIEGKYQFVGDDGQLYVTSFRGGPDGFHVNGEHLPVQVPMPVI